ncbi:hypothetical protein [Helicobacter canis]|uniref:hypothetical protein n=1 Tax=Helicobacter canis TaxID=29419 RepID=UPI000E0E6913|nr:hypothetical protein [Helicobacter canis]
MDIRLSSPFISQASEGEIAHFIIASLALASRGKAKFLNIHSLFYHYEPCATLPPLSSRADVSAWRSILESTFYTLRLFFVIASKRGSDCVAIHSPTRIHFLCFYGLPRGFSIRSQ